MPDAYARFGKKQAKGIFGSYTCSVGTAPGAARLRTGPNFGQVGQVDQLTIHFRGDVITLRDALVVDPQSTGDVSSAPSISFTALDRRWKWQHGGRVYGDYNRENKNGTLTRQASPRDLAATLFQALGEAKFDVSALPAAPRPRAVWDASKPVDELNRLCSDFGCVVVFDPIADAVGVARIGTGSAPLARPHIERADARVIPAPPDGVRVVGGPAMFQTALALGEPVGREVDGSWKPIDQLSYAPAGGFGTLDPFEFVDMCTEYTDPATGEINFHRDLAIGSVWRAYRISGQLGGGFTPSALIGTAYEPRSILDLGPFTGTLLDKDPLTDERLPAYVRGVFYAEEDRLALDNVGNTQPNTRFPGSVRIDSEQRLAIFDRPLFKYGENFLPEPADVTLIAAYGVSSKGVPVRWEEWRNAQVTHGAGEAVEHHSEIVAEFIQATASANGQQRNNLANVQRQMNYYLDAMAQRYENAEATNAKYGGILTNVKLDGRLRSITWDWSTAGAPTTHCSWNCERSPYVIPWEERNDARSLRAAEYAVRRAEGRRRISASRTAASADV